MTVENQLLENEEKLLTAFKNKDLTVLEELIHHDSIFILPNSKTVTKSMVLENYRTGTTEMFSINASDRIMNIIADTAVVSLNQELNGKYNDQTFNTHFRYLRVWKLFEKGWKVIATSGIQTNP